MADLAFPQLSTGAQVQYPLRKRRVMGSTINAFSDGSIVSSRINGVSQRVWELAYTDLTLPDKVALQALFEACEGPLKPFVFIDPTGNMITSSSDLTSGPWLTDPLLSVIGGAIDPTGENTAFTIANHGESDQQLTQRILAPSSYRYCFSIYASAAAPCPIIFETKSQSSQSSRHSVGLTWSRISYSGQLTERLMNFTISIAIPAAQTVTVWGPQLEPQISPSRYRKTATVGGVYQSAHFLGDSITFKSDAPGLFSTLISIETT